MLLENFINSNAIFVHQAIFSTLYIGSPQVNRITMISGVSIQLVRAHHHMLIHRHYKLHLHFVFVWLAT